MSVYLLGVVNVTSDSFSDGGKYLESDRAIQHAEFLLSSGADFVEFGADSSRPGSRCVGADLEWQRLEPILNNNFSNFSVDTHHVEIARKAIKSGAKIINDITAGSEQGMFELLATSNSKLILMHSASKKAHTFASLNYDELMDSVTDFFNNKITLATAAGVKREQLIIDPGMGGFISDDPQVSYRLLENYSKLQCFELPLVLAVSRKRFIAYSNLEEADEKSFLLAAQVSKQIKEVDLYVRCHNPAIHLNLK